ncbi:MAG: hypothetical protein QNJ97_09870 [Myxococcota bacterium]|nr:hypothetical protein [Myxococcota bacterium]
MRPILHAIWVVSMLACTELREHAGVEHTTVVAKNVRVDIGLPHQPLVLKGDRLYLDTKHGILRLDGNASLAMTKDEMITATAAQITVHPQAQQISLTGGVSARFGVGKR